VFTGNTAILGAYTHSHTFRQLLDSHTLYSCHHWHDTDHA